MLLLISISFIYCLNRSEVVVLLSKGILLVTNKFANPLVCWHYNGKADTVVHQLCTYIRRWLMEYIFGLSFERPYLMQGQKLMLMWIIVRLV